MKLLLLQTDIRWLAPDENRRRAEELIENAGAFGVAGGVRGKTCDPGGAGAFGTSETSGTSGTSGTFGTSGAAGTSEASGGVDLIVLPEMFTTGFAVDPAGAAEGDAGAATVEWMRAIAVRTDAAVAGSVAVEEGGRFYNRFFFVKPDGSVAHYDKHHLFSFGGEHLRYMPGRERVVVEWRGWRILLQVCYDLRFPVFARNGGGNGGSRFDGDIPGNPDYDMVLYVASWPTVRIHPWNTLLRARAIENVCWAVGVNRTGDDPFASYSGGTALIDFKGETAAAAAEGEDAVLCEVDLGPLRAFRARFPALADADGFTLS